MNNYFTTYRNLMNRSQNFITILLFTGLLISFSCGKKQQNYFQETGPKAIYQRALDLQKSYHVLMISLQPGFEDLSALAYLRMESGAQVTSAYVMNGESGESDIQAENPTHLASIRRREAFNALSFLDCGAYFINMPDVAAARDSEKVREKWSADLMKSNLTKMITQVQPDIILLVRDWQGANGSWRWQCLYSDLLDVVEKLSVENEKSITKTEETWYVSRVFSDNWNQSGIKIPVNNEPSIWSETYGEIASAAGERYASQKNQRSEWMKKEQPAYRLVYPSFRSDIQDFSENLAGVASPKLKPIEQRIQTITQQIIDRKANKVLVQLASVLDSVNILMPQRARFSNRDRQKLIFWNTGIESLRSALLGVNVDYTISDTLLTRVQLTYFTVNNVSGIHNKGDTYIFFADVDKDRWVVDESVQRRFPLKLGTQYRLLSPSEVNYNYPPGNYEFTSNSYATPFRFFIMHREEAKEYNFTYLFIRYFNFAQKFSIDLETPIVRMIPGEKVFVRLMNISRDGVQDTMKVDNPLATSTTIPFRLHTKGATKYDSLTIFWQGNPDDGSYLIPLKTRYMEVANFVARKFDTEVDTSKHVAVIPAKKNSPVLKALQQLPIRYTTLDTRSDLSNQLTQYDVLILDHRLLSLHEEIINYYADLNLFAENGGHLIILSQDADAWNRNPLIDGITLEPTLKYDAQYPITFDHSHSLLSSPNKIHQSDWEDWLYLRAKNDITGSALIDFQKPITTELNNPLVITKTKGKGKITFVDLALNKQWQNINPGAFRLLANLIAF